MTCILLNQLATPGLGSWMAGYQIAGAGQLLLAGTGFGLFVYWFMQLMSRLWATFGDAPLQEQAPGLPWAWRVGVALFGLSWLWAGITSVAIYRSKPTVPPVIGS